MGFHVASGSSTDITMAPSYRQITDSDKPFRSNLDYRHQHGPRWHHRPLIPIWSSVAAQSTEVNMASDHGSDHRCPHSFRW